MNIILIDHYDSFTNNVKDWLLHGGFKSVQVIPYDTLDDEPSRIDQGQALVFSPGPKCPENIAPSAKLLREYLGKIPILGICLGHQLIASEFHWNVQPSKQPLHGALRTIQIMKDHPLFLGLERPFQAASYNSLAIYPPTMVLNDRIRVLARCQDGDVQAFEVLGIAAPCIGVQFHPESFLTPDSLKLAKNLFQFFR